MNQSIHAVDLLQWYMGPVDTVSAMTGTLGHKGIEVEDTAVVTIRFQNGVLGTIEGSAACYPGFLKRVELYDPAAIDYAGHRIQFENFARAVRSGGSPLVDGAEARKAVEIILAVYKSASEGDPVSLPL